MPTWDELRTLRDRTANLPRPLQVMQQRHGALAGKRCGDCVYLVRIRADMRTQPLKCVLYGDTRSAASDWRRTWPACGAFEQR